MAEEPIDGRAWRPAGSEVRRVSLDVNLALPVHRIDQRRNLFDSILLVDSVPCRVEGDVQALGLGGLDGSQNVLREIRTCEADEEHWCRLLHIVTRCLEFRCVFAGMESRIDTKHRNRASGILLVHGIRTPDLHELGIRLCSLGSVQFRELCRVAGAINL